MCACVKRFGAILFTNIMTSDKYCNRTGQVVSFYMHMCVVVNVERLCALTICIKNKQT